MRAGSGRPRTPAIGLAAAALVAGAIAPGAAGAGECLTPRGSEVRFDPSPLARRPSLLFVSAERRTPLASGSKLLLVRGEATAPGADALARVVEEGYRRIVVELGFRGFPDRVAVSFAELPGDGFVSAGARGSSAEIVLSSALAGPALVQALAHQVGHLAGLGYARDEPAWWSEATAAWVAARLLPADDGAADAELRDRLADPARSLAPSAPEPGRGSATWLDFLESRFGGDLVRRVWEEAAAVPGESVLRATDAVLAAEGTTLRGELEAYAAWLVAEARRLEASGSGGDLRYAGEARQYPARGQATELGPEAMGAAFVHLAAADVAGGLRIEVSADPGETWSASAVVVPAGSKLPAARVSLPFTAPGRAELAVPTSDVAEVVLAVTRTGGSGRMPFRWEVLSDEAYPMTLRRLDATRGDGGVRLFWATASESDVYGWSVLRSAAPEEEFVPLNQVLVPGAQVLGLPGGAEYVFHDAAALPGRNYYYYLEALTGAGLPASSHILAVTARSE